MSNPRRIQAFFSGESVPPTRRCFVGAVQYGPAAFGESGHSCSSPLGQQPCRTRVIGSPRRERWFFLPGPAPRDHTAVQDPCAKYRRRIALVFARAVFFFPESPRAIFSRCGCLCAKPLQRVEQQSPILLRDRKARGNIPPSTQWRARRPCQAHQRAIVRQAFGPPPRRGANARSGPTGCFAHENPATPAGARASPPSPTLRRENIQPSLNMRGKSLSPIPPPLFNKKKTQKKTFGLSLSAVQILHLSQHRPTDLPERCRIRATQARCAAGVPPPTVGAAEIGSKRTGPPPPDIERIAGWATARSSGIQTALAPGQDKTRSPQPQLLPCPSSGRPAGNRPSKKPRP